MAGVIKRGGEGAKNQYRIPFAAAVKTREKEEGEGLRRWREGGRGCARGGGWMGGLVMCE